MRIPTTKTLPAYEDLITLLRSEFSDKYDYELFGLADKKSILVGKSPFVGAQVSIAENEITIQGTPPSMLTGNFLFFFSLVGVDTVLGLLYGSKLKKFERELAIFLKNRFG